MPGPVALEHQPDGKYKPVCRLHEPQLYLGEPMSEDEADKACDQHVAAEHPDLADDDEDNDDDFDASKKFSNRRAYPGMSGFKALD